MPAAALILLEYRAFFWSNGFPQSQYDRRQITFPTVTAGLPPPPRAFLYEHFRQAVLANMRGADTIPNLDFNKEEEARDMVRLGEGDGKDSLETFLADQLVEKNLEDGEDSGDTMHGEDEEDRESEVSCESCRRCVVPGVVVE